MNRQQNLKRKVFSLKYKILILLISITSVGLGGFLFISLNHFTKDKTNYLLENSTQLTSAEAEIISKEMDKALEYLGIIANNYNPAELSFNEQAKLLFSQQKAILKAQMVEWSGRDLRRGNLLNKTDEDIEMNMISFSSLGQTEEMAFFCRPEDISKVLAVVSVQGKAGTFLVSEVFIPHIRNLIDRKGLQFAIYCPKSGSELYKLSEKVPKFDTANLKESMATSRSLTKEIKVQGVNYIMNASAVDKTPILLLSFVDAKSAMGVIKQLQVQASLVFLSILGIVCIVALISANELTSTLEGLTMATRRIASGDFKFNLAIKSNDEMSLLADSFQWMKVRILELLEETKNAARMEAELETATTVQGTLFPPTEAIGDTFEVSGIFKTASECGGDLWHYFETDKYLFVFIGDVVGHGVPAALMTTAARSVTSIVRLQGIDSPAEVLKLLNHSIHETSKGKMWMTFLVGRFDKQSGELKYSSASQNPGFLFRNIDEVKKSDVEVLMDSVGSSLGREEKAEYVEASVTLNVGDMAFFYTDGLTECANSKKELLGESKLVRALVKKWNADREPKAFVASVHEIMEKHRANHPLEDDVTFFALKRLR